jgi:hypothetical protein
MSGVRWSLGLRLGIAGAIAAVLWVAMATQPGSDAVGAGYVAVFVLFPIALFIVAIADGARLDGKARERLIRSGLATAAEVTGVKVEPTDSGFSSVLDYRYAAPNGRQHGHVTVSHRLDLQPGDRILIRYDPADPAVSGWSGDVVASARLDAIAAQSPGQGSAVGAAASAPAVDDPAQADADAGRWIGGVLGFVFFPILTYGIGEVFGVTGFLVAAWAGVLVIPVVLITLAALPKPRQEGVVRIWMARSPTIRGYVAGAFIGIAISAIVVVPIIGQNAGYIAKPDCSNGGCDGGGD